ncbi:uncharacterized protein P174DRAFT_439634 [Aspergillus novofumigatus IBT 16806]|uniref:Uncharacterized protein n=1 Tax=Aspergillus novofumigatus (strain IBT 16806) TaxID=1392255 RepID=A0A2I1CBF0_ASPN1|nr:uncharacterized protein P174DRAFT_439634 [Aspergillus novofumigatus IBT 16806]PKX94968.1 hypothetical protein P174DRAFT_439634 [Aspergillus novofumigatus IBT 16806]
MPKKGGKGKKGKGKGGGGTAKKAPTVQEPVTPGHQVEDVVKGEGEGETTESLAPGTATNVPSAAPPQAAETVAASTGGEGTSTAETTENGDSSNEEVEQVSGPGTAKRFSLAEHPAGAEGRELRMPSSLPDTGAAAESEANENTLQGAVGKTQASKAGLVGSLDAGDGEGQAVLPDTVAKESELTAPTTAPETTVPEATTSEAAAPVPVVTDASAPVSEAPAETALPERLKEKETAAAEPTATSPSDRADLPGHAKRPYESSLFHKDEDHKPPKMAKVGDSETATAATETKAADLQTEVPSESTVQPLIVPGLGAESTDKPAEIPQKVDPAEAVAPTTAPSTAQAAASTTSPVVPAAVATAGAGSEAEAETKEKQEVKESIEAFTGEGQVPATKEPQQEPEATAKERAQETAPVKTTPETPTKAKPNVAAVAAAAAMRGKSSASPAPATEAADKTEGEPKETQPETQDQVPTETPRGEEAAAKETQPEATEGKKSHEEAQTAVDKAQEAARAEAAKAEKRKSGFWSWIKRKVKGT